MGTFLNFQVGMGVKRNPRCRSILAKKIPSISSHKWFMLSFLGRNWDPYIVIIAAFRMHYFKKVLNFMYAV